MKTIKHICLMFTVIVGLTLHTRGVSAYYSDNKTRMYDGWVIAAIDVSPGDWGSRAEYTGWNPPGLRGLELQTQIQGTDYRVRLFHDWAEDSANGNKWVVRTGGYNAIGNTGRNYARAIGYYWSGGDERVATAYQ